MASNGMSPAACSLTWLPDSLYNTCVAHVASEFTKHKDDLHLLPLSCRFDAYWTLFRQGKLCQLGVEFYNLDIFIIFLELRHERHKLHQCFQVLMDHGLRLSEVLVNAYAQRCLNTLKAASDSNFLRDTVLLGFNLGSFLIEAGWYVDGERCIRNCQMVAEHCTLPEACFWKMECFMWLLESYNGFCRFDEAERIVAESQILIKEITDGVDSVKEEIGITIDEAADSPSSRQMPSSPNFTVLYCEYSAYYYSTSRYDQAATWAIEALTAVTANTPIKVMIQACRQAAKVFSVKRRFKEAGILINHAMSLTNYYFEQGKRLPETLSDYGLYLMSVDLVEVAAKVYQAALDYRLANLGGDNIKVAQAHEELAYVLYVQEYSSGHFTNAREHAERAIEVTKKLVPEQHLLLASCRRVKALILEEIAIDSNEKAQEYAMLSEAEELHLSALTFCKGMFGDDNLQTAKHYGNLGRLYQSMERYKEAEEMHLKAISIKERLLRSDDYEVALSVGHLASLYNYDLQRYEEAERLYLRSIEIGQKLFGESYSGLEYDYRGLLRVYANLRNEAKTYEYMYKLQRWKQIRDEAVRENSPDHVLSSIAEYPRDTLEVIREVLHCLS